MMITKLDKMSASSPSWERAQRLFDKITELESRRRRSAQARVPSDPNAWQQIRENYEAIILEDHAFSEQHNVEYALWQLHYKRIDELRTHFSAAMASTGSNSSQGLKGPTRPDRITKIRLQFKTFLSEATGFYHDLIVKIRAKYGLPLGYFSEDSENRIVMDKDGKKSADMKKGLISCHRCLIYLGDLARYKGLYGEGDSKTREYAAASSYYLQAASCLPSSGNPHHQLAILASYSGDELVTVYRYFRSLAVDNPFSTARDNLIVAFEKNRQSYSQLSGNANASALKELPARLTGKGRGKGEAIPAKDNNTEAGLVKERSSSNQEKYKAFSIRFVRLNGILFTRTSLETFAEVLSVVSSGLYELLSSGAEEELSLGADAVENGLVIVRLVSILIFTVHNVKKESEGQSYAEIVQRAVLLQNAFTAVFELMGHVLERCVKLGDPTSSHLLPGILVFVEWLACCPDVAAGSDADEKQSSVRAKFWNACIHLLNNLLSSVPMSIDDDGDETCFNNMSRYEEGETENRLALWEDFELRGFMPLLPAQTILDFSRKHSFGSDGQKEKGARLKRILAAGKALANVVKVDQKAIYFDSQTKKFVIGVEPSMNGDYMPTSFLGMANSNDNLEENQVEDTKNLGGPFQKPELTMDGDEEDEVIVFKPIVAEKRPDVVGTTWAIPQHLEPFKSEEISLANNLKSLGFMGNGQVLKSDHVSSSVPFQQPVNGSTSSMFYSHAKAPEAVLPFKVDTIASSGPFADGLTLKTSSALPAAIRKNPVSRPVRHLGPPPGFSHVPAKQVNESIYNSESMGENPLMDDYSWLDGYQVPSSTKGNAFSSSINYSSHSNLHRVPNGNGLSGTVNFPFPGKQGPSMPFQAENQKSRQEFHMLDDLKLHHEMQLQQQQQPEQYQGQSVWTGRYFV
ncbi:nonsense-mediated mRNA decay factor SMG7 [Rosa rugosa]|uniref:nonsense-mediated mRNA decay factor SMG7 n=1 Tax=Rosa rugosa TaxID=74645 RepID=UPI002B4143D1|nr:nonsense-mediated mRNA decay factor SMG7 [Rosa rugosa]